MPSAGKDKWIHRRHDVIGVLALPVLRLMCRIRYHAKIVPYRKPGQYLLLFNHQTPFDQFFAGISFGRVIYFVATEDIFSAGFLSRLLRYFVAPVPIKKSTMDIGAMKKILQVVREGGSLAIAPEGNRTYSGRTGYINPSVAALAKKIGLPILLYRIEGGYGAEPRWSDRVRRGPLKAYVSEEISAEEVQSLEKEALYERICSGLAVDEADSQESYRSNLRAEYMERMTYVCPFCGFAPFESSGNRVKCLRCGRTVLYGEDKRLSGEGFDFPFPYAADWYEYQMNYVNGLDVTENTDTPYFIDTTDLDEVILHRRKVPLGKDVSSELYGDRVVLTFRSGETRVLHFDDVSAAAVLGRNKLNLYHGGHVYQFKGNRRFNALKYVNIYYRYQNIRSGHPDELFLGL